MTQEHEQGGHAVLSPSASERWISCPASIRMAATVPEPPESAWAREGTAAHALGEMKAREQLLGRTPEQTRDDWRAEFDIEPGSPVEQEMDRHTDAYVDLLRDRLGRHPDTVLLLEQRVQTGVPMCWGTSDAVLVSPRHVEIVDFKYGQGVRVDAYRNSQLMLYGVGALETYGSLLGEPELVTVTVHQPRLHHTDSYSLTAEELVAWRDGLIPLAEAALGPDAPFGPGEEVCRWCPVSGSCRAQRDDALSADFDAEPDALSPEELAEELGRVGRIRVWLNALEAHALHVAYSEGKTIPGWKVVRSGGRRVVADPAGAMEALASVGWALDDVAPRSLKGIGALEEMLGGDFAVVNEYIKKTEGKESLVPEADRRPAIDPNTEAAKEFLL